MITAIIRNTLQDLLFLEQYNKGVACDNTNDDDTNVFPMLIKTLPALSVGIFNKKVKEHDAKNV